MIVACLSASKSVQSMATLISVRAPTTWRTQWGRTASRSMPGLDSSRSTCLTACFVFKPLATARPCPIACTAREPVRTTPSVAFASDRTRLACMSVPISPCRNCSMSLNPRAGLGVIGCLAHRVAQGLNRDGRKGASGAGTIDGYGTAGGQTRFLSESPGYHADSIIARRDKWEIRGGLRADLPIADDYKTTLGQDGCCSDVAWVVRA